MYLFRAAAVRFFWDFAGHMLMFFDKYSCCKEQSMDRREFQYAWFFLYWSLQFVTYAQNKKSPKLKQLALYAAVAFAIRIRNDLGKPVHSRILEKSESYPAH